MTRTKLTLFPYKSLKSETSSNFETFTATTLKLQEVGRMFFHVMQTIHFIHVCAR